ncbi:MAG: cryptochrome/photolyase family protein [Pseudomonadales bacterium]|nr:cryptochrome/photolyase family protein [Pseudomonadales bacterium]
MNFHDLSLPKEISELRLLLGDQLNARHSWFKTKDSNIVYIIAEVREEASYAKHHIQKICAFFKAMETFAQALKKAKHQVIYLTLDDTAEYESFQQLLDYLIAQLKPKAFSYQQPDEYRLNNQLQSWSEQASLPVECVSSEHFLIEQEAIGQYLEKDQQWRLEFFYRRLRKEQKVLMEGDQPVGDQWNYDKENRVSLPKDWQPPKPLLFKNNIGEIRQRIEKHRINTIGSQDGDQLIWPCNRRESLRLLDYFCKELLPFFGTYQDAMSDDEWSIYHSRISFSLNTKMLHPMEVIRKVEAAYFKENAVTIAQAEGFIRQILGWREFIRAVYWQSQPNYEKKNYFNAQTKLPEFFWSGDTQMRCMSKAIGQSLTHAYAHHIQRLMITGNFCLIAGIDPFEVHEWYLGIYIDALEWVEAPNTLSMSQFADGGKLASKPYSCGGNYIHKMSDHCKSCHYSVTKKHGEGSCPFNSLYWHFLDRHEPLLGKNHRLSMIYRNWQKRKPEEKKEIIRTAEHYLNNLDNL